MYKIVIGYVVYLQNNPDVSEDNSNASKPRSFIEQYFGGIFDYELKCIESEDEPATVGKDEFLQLSCFISTDVKHMYFGLRNKMQEQITKMSSTLGRNATYTKTVNLFTAYIARIRVCVCVYVHLLHYVIKIK